MLEGGNPIARHDGKGLERVTFCHGVELSYCLVTVRALTETVPFRCLASCPQKGLIAIGLEYSKCICAVIEVKQLRDKVNQEAKDEQCVFSLSLLKELLSLNT